MKFTIARENLLKSLQAIIGAVEKRQTMSILSNVMLSANEQQLSLIATDLEVELSGSTKLEKLTEPGEVTVPAAKLLDICRTLQDGSSVKIHTAEKSRMILRSEKSHFVLSTLPVSEFPNVGSISDEKKVVEFYLPQNKLKKLLGGTYFAMAQQDVRYYLNGIFFDINQEVMKIVASDGHRLAYASLPDVKVADRCKAQVIIPRKGVIELMRLLDDVDDAVKVTIGSNHIYANIQDYTFTSKLVDGKFPNYNQVIPKNGDKSVVINREKLKQALMRVAILSNEQFRGIRVLLTKGAMKLFTNNYEQEKAEEELEIDYSGADLEIAFNVNYLIDVCNTIVSNNIQLIFSNADVGILIEESREDGDYVYVIMPMRL